jgi:hypothetical protein
MDRYLLFLLPGALAVSALSDSAAKLRWTPALGLLALSAAVSLCLVHDWLAWNSARWELGRRAVARGVEPDEIEGGFEWNGWHSAEQRPRRRSKPAGRMTLPITRGLFRNVTGRYAMAFSAPQGATIVDREPYSTWLWPGRNEFFLVEAPTQSP